MAASAGKFIALQDFKALKEKISRYGNLIVLLSEFHGCFYHQDAMIQFLYASEIDLPHPVLSRKSKLESQQSMKILYDYFVDS